MHEFPVSCVLGVLGLCGYVACAGLVFAGGVYEFFVASRKNVVLHRFIKFLPGISPHHLPVKGPDHAGVGRWVPERRPRHVQPLRLKIRPVVGFLSRAVPTPWGHPDEE